MADEMIRAFGTTKTLEASGGSITNNSIVQADDASYSTASDGADYPHAEFALSFTFGTNPTEGATIGVYARKLNVDGTGDAEAPETGRPDTFIGFVRVNNVTTLQYAAFFAYDVPREADYYLHNVATGQTISSGWTLKVTPMTYKPTP